MGANGYRHGMRATCGVLLLAGSLASAQDAPAPGDGVLQEVVVTARGRVEELQTVPLAITSISGKDLEITKENDRVVIRFAYNKEVPVAGPVYVLLKYAGRSK